MKNLVKRIAKRTKKGQRGAAAVVVGASLTALFGAAAIGVDLGQQRSSHRSAVNTADAAALAAAGELGDGESETVACAKALLLVDANDAGTMTECTVFTAASGAEAVRVKVTNTVNYTFAPVIGVSDGLVDGVTTVVYGAAGVSGARPMGLCMSWLNGIPELANWDQTSSTGVIEVDYGNGGGQANACGGAAGNWGSLDFDGGSNSNNDQKDWIRDGYDGVLYPDTWVEGNPGAMAGWASSSLQSLVNSGEIFPVPLFTSVSGGSGANAQFQVTGFVQVQLVDFKVNGSASGRTLEMIFHPSEYPGIPCCDPAGTPIEVAEVAVCGFDGDESNC